MVGWCYQPTTFFNLERNDKKMNDAFLCFIEIVKEIAPYSIAWGLGIRAYRYIVGAMTGKENINP